MSGPEPAQPVLRKKKRRTPHQGDRLLRPGGEMPPPQKKHAEVPIVDDAVVSRGCYDDFHDVIEIPSCGMPSDPSQFITSFFTGLYPTLPPPPEIREGPPPPPPKKPNGGKPGEPIGAPCAAAACCAHHAI